MNRITTSLARDRKSWIGAFLVLLAVSSTWSLAGGNCVSADIPWQMEMPDGSVHEPGRVTLCYIREYNPVSGPVSTSGRIVA